MRRFIRSFGLPILLVGLLAGTLGFYVARAVAGDTSERIAEVSVVSLPATPSPTPSPVPSPTAGTARGRRGTRDPRCPSGCECSFPSGGTVVVCRGGGTVRVP